jgi:hypothetical protein
LTSLSSSSPSSLVTGIKNWRTILCAKDSLLSSQTGSTDLLDRLDREPALKYAITGDQSIIITPCSLPPSLKTVQKWYEGRKVYKNLKKKASLQEEAKGKKGNSKENREVAENSKKLASETEKVNVSENIESTESKFTKVTPKRNAKDQEEKVTKSETTFENLDIKSPSAELEDLIESPGQSQSQDIESTLLHSTPVLRRGSTDLFEPECTPITGEKRNRNSQGDEGSDFMTPKRIRPIRRLSTQTDSTLRKAILSSQVRVSHISFKLA